MSTKPTYEELAQRVKELEQEKLESNMMKETINGGERASKIESKRNTEIHIPDVDLESIINVEEIQSIMDNLPIGIAVNSVDPAVKFEYVNDNFLKFYRTTRKAVADPDAFWTSVYEEANFREEIKKRILDDCASGDPGRMYWVDVPITRKGEETSFICARNIPVPDKQLMISIVWDVTDRKQTEEALRDSERLLNEVGRIAKIGGWEMDLTTGKAKWTRGTYEIVEIETGEPVPGPDEHVSYYLPEYRPLVEESMRRLIEEDIPLEFEAEARTAKGNIKWCRALGRGIREGGECVKAYGTLQDITERKRAEEERDRILSLSKDLICIAGMDGFFKYVNPAWEQVLGYSTQELLSRPFLDFIYPDDHEPSDAEVARLSEGLKTGEFENRYVCRDGSIRHILWKAIPLSEEKLIYAIGRDITERKHAEDVIRESEEKLRLTIDNSPLGVGTVDPMGNYISTNHTYEKMLGYSKEELREMSLFDVTHPDDRPENRKLFGDMISSKTSAFNMEKRCIRKDGNIINVLIHAGGIRDAEGKLMFGLAFMEDITDRKQAEKELKKYRDKLEKMVEERTRELEKRNAELERMHKLFVGREFRIKELRDKIRELEERQGIE